MKSASYDIKDILIAATDYELGDDLFISAQPAKPINCIAIFDGGGQPPKSDFDKNSIFRDSIQIMVRNISYLAGWDEVFKIAKILHNITNKTYNGAKYIRVEQRSGAESFVSDNYIEFSVNFIITRKQI